MKRVRICGACGVGLLALGLAGCGGSEKNTRLPNLALCGVNVAFRGDADKEQIEAVKHRVSRDPHALGIALYSPSQLAAAMKHVSPRQVDEKKLPNLLQVRVKSAADGAAVTRALRPRPPGVVQVYFDPSVCELPRGPEALSADERRAFGNEIEAELIKAQKRKATRLQEDRRVLDAVPHFPGSRLLGERQNPQDTARLGETRHREELDLYASSSSKLSVEDYLDWAARDWSTFRSFTAPAGTTPKQIQEFFVRRVPSRLHFTIERVDTLPSYGLSFTRGRTCLWFIIYGSEALRSRFDVSVDRRGLDPSC
jgi:hypothetical protein